MKKRWRTLGLLTAALAALLAAVSLVHRSAATEVKPISAALEERLEHTVIPLAEIREASPEAAVQWLNQLLQEHLAGPGPACRLVLWTDPQPPAGFQRRRFQPIRAPTIPGLDWFSGEMPREHQLINERRMTMSLTSIPLSEVLRYTASLLDCSVGQQGSNLLLIDGPGGFEPIVERTFSFPRVLLTGPPETARDQIEHYLTASGADFREEGTSVEIIPGGDVKIRNTPKEIDLIGVMLDQGGPPTFFQRLKEAWVDGWFAVRCRLRLP